ncbi:protein still life, isoform SIF type 1 [Caerostris extrusa]|uniref:Protein still life, isoform SIF type 1 n=1 Tax=Caerostris extrusa TaxID=172846 RepID=A0AAV4R4A3_CAEEX|nr:protein still life, isoform SIF type 1 [Caerostris extrusa]
MHEKWITFGNVPQMRWLETCGVSDGEQAKLFLRPAHTEGLPLRRLPLAKCQGDRTVTCSGQLWAEVFHVSATSGAVKWQQVSEDLVPVNITCIQDTPDCVFHITAYNSQVEKILDVRLVQPGTRLGQASECFVYWKDPATGIPGSPSFKFSRKASSSYSLKLEPPKQQKTKGKRKPQSTPSSPSRSRELQCTCMTAENLHRARNGRVRYTGAATLPRVQPRSVDDYKISYDNRSSRQQTHASSTSVYDNASLRRGTTTASVHGGGHKSNRLDPTSNTHTTVKTSLQERISDVGAAYHHQDGRQGNNQARQLYAQSTRKEQAKSIDCSLMSGEEGEDVQARRTAASVEEQE